MLASLSARRAWIEIGIVSIVIFCIMVALRKESVDRNSSGAKADSVSEVALRKESVDRNSYFYIIKITVCRSLSARRAWIEILYKLNINRTAEVALRKESVDRNNAVKIIVIIVHGRSPQGERG